MKRRKAFAVVVLFGLLLAFTSAARAQSQPEVFDPNSLVKNPYQFKGHSGILNTLGTPVLMPNGAPAGNMVVPFASMRFERMLDEHTAMYEVEAYEEGAMMPQGELAVIVKDSTAPDPSRRWKVEVDGPMKGWNGFGATITVTAVRFDGYYVPPPPTAEELRQQEAALKAQQEAALKAQQEGAKAEAEEKARRQREYDQLAAQKMEQNRLGKQQYCNTLIAGGTARSWMRANTNCDDPSQWGTLSDLDKATIQNQVDAHKGWSDERLQQGQNEEQARQKVDQQLAADRAAREKKQHDFEHEILCGQLDAAAKDDIGAAVMLKNQGCTEAEIKEQQQERAEQAARQKAQQDQTRKQLCDQFASRGMKDPYTLKLYGCTQ